MGKAPEEHGSMSSPSMWDVVAAPGSPARAAAPCPMLAGASSEPRRFAPSTDFKDVLDVHPYEIKITPAHCKQTSL